MRPERPAVIVTSLSTEEAADVSEEVFPLMNAVVWGEATFVVLDAASALDERIIDQAAELHESGVRVRTRTLFYEEWLGKIPVHELGRVSLFFDIGEVHRDRYGRMKRVFDVAVALVGLFSWSCCSRFVFVGNLIGNRGPTLLRPGAGWSVGKNFSIHKFRTMRAEADLPDRLDVIERSSGHTFRPDAAGQHLDELPQVVNILRGDLSLVGPRPEQPRYVEELQEKLPFYDMRHIVRPGLTGWAQVKYRYGGDERDALEKLQYDFHYLRRQSLLFDLRIIVRTIRRGHRLEGTMSVRSTCQSTATFTDCDRMTPPVTILLPTLNERAFVHDCLEA